MSRAQTKPKDSMSVNEFWGIKPKSFWTKQRHVPRMNHNVLPPNAGVDLNSALEFLNQLTTKEPTSHLAYVQDIDSDGMGLRFPDPGFEEVTG